MNFVVVLLLFALSLPVEVDSIERRGLHGEEFILSDSDENQDERSQYDSAGFLIGQNPLVSKEDYEELAAIENDEYDTIEYENENYLDGMEEMEDYEESEEEGESEFYSLDEDGESEEGYEEFDEENEIMMSRSQNGDLNFDEFDEESEDYIEYDTMEKEYDTIENDESEIAYPDDMYGNIDNDNLDADYADATDAKYELDTIEIDEYDTIEYDKYGNQILNNSEDYEESDEEESQFDDLDEFVESDNDDTEGLEFFSIDDDEKKESSSSVDMGAFGGIGTFGSNVGGDNEYESASYDDEREEKIEEVEALESDIEDTMEKEETKRTVSVETKGALLPNNTVKDILSMFDEGLCSKSTLMRTSVEDFVGTAALVDGETSLGCASDAATLTTCIICNKCTNCNDKFYQLKKEQNGSCEEQSELFEYCGCDACQEEEKVLLACLCPNSAASNLGIWLALASILLSILFLN